MRFLYWIAVIICMYVGFSAVRESSTLIMDFEATKDFTSFAASIHDMFLAVLSMLGILIATIAYGTPTVPTKVKEETTTHLEVR